MLKWWVIGCLSAVPPFRSCTGGYMQQGNLPNVVVPLAGVASPREVEGVTHVIH